MYNPRLKRAIKLALQNPTDNSMQTREDSDVHSEHEKFIEEYYTRLKSVLINHLEEKWHSFPHEQIKTQLEQWQEAGTDFTEESTNYRNIDVVLNNWLNENRDDTEKEVAEVLFEAMGRAFDKAMESTS